MSKEEITDSVAVFDSKIAPKLEQVPYTAKWHGMELPDNYHWVDEENESSQEALSGYLDAEQKYTSSYFAQPKIEKTITELDEWLNNNQLSSKSFDSKQIGDYIYFQGLHPQTNSLALFRKEINSEQNAAQVVINPDDFKGTNFKMNFFSISPNQKLVVFGVDEEDNEDFTLVVYDIENAKYLEDKIPSTFYSETDEDYESSGYLAWHSSGQGFFYAADKQGFSPKKLMFHKLGTSHTEDQVIMEASEDKYSIRVDRNADNSCIIIDYSDGISHKLYQLPLDTNNLKPELVADAPNTFCKITHHPDGYFYAYIRDDKTLNAKILRCKKDSLNPDLSKWEEFIAEDSEAYLLPNFYLSKNYAVLTYVKNANYYLVGHNLNGNTNNSKVILEHKKEPTLISVKECDPFSDKIKVECSSLLKSEYQLVMDLLTGEQQTVATSGCNSLNPEDYTLEQIFAPTDNAVKIPVTLLYKTSTFLKNGSNPLCLKGYGAFGDIFKLDYTHELYALLEKGFVYAVAHIRGGGDCGKQWHKDGMLFNKQNSFDDFKTVAKYLTKEKYSSPEKMVAIGGSAGGLLVGAVMNQEPSLFKAVIAQIPAIDLLNMDFQELYNEFGNAKESKEAFEYILKYSPYQNVTPQNYPHLLVRAGLNDARVPIKDVAKWVAKLRAEKTDDNPLIFYTTEDGHFDSNPIQSFILESAFIMDALGMNAEILGSDSETL